MTGAIIGSIGIALIALIGAPFFKNKQNTEGLHRIVLPIAVGVFLGVVFFELIPETLHASEFWGAISILTGFLGFYLLSHFLDTYHHHHGDEHDTCAHHDARKLLIGDAVHNLADGVVIATSFMLNPMIGIATTIGIAFHEIPQEIAEYAILRGAGYSEKRALFLNFLSASTVVVGVILTYLVGAGLGDYIFVLTGVAAGNLLYIATTDLLPELRHSHRDHFVKTFFATLLGVAFIGTLITVSHNMFEML
jgi:zinc and cadmium transporter